MKALINLTMVILIISATGCAPKEKLVTDYSAVGIPLPIYPSDKVMEELQDKFGAHPYGPVWFYMHEDFKNKCAQERALGKTCKF